MGSAMARGLVEGKNGVPVTYKRNEMNEVAIFRNPPVYSSRTDGKVVLSVVRGA